MAGWAQSFGGATIAATASVCAALLSYLRGRANERSNIVQDLDIAEKLSDDSRAKEVLEAYIQYRAERLPLEKVFRYTLWPILGLIAVVTGQTVIATIGDFFRATDTIDNVIWVVIVVVVFGGFRLWTHYDKKSRTRLASELGLAPETFEQSTPNSTALASRSRSPCRQLSP
jgi:hypothetical protein